jgi:hypothetical protein
MATETVRKLQSLHLKLTSAGNVSITWALLAPIRAQLLLVLLCVCIPLLPLYMCYLLLILSLAFTSTDHIQ